MNKTVSIVVPVYNSEQYINRCIDSLLCQDYPNIEIVIVDDGSIDNSLNICKQYEAKNKNIRVFHFDNGGLSFARNQGIKKSSGEYIMFVDSDDSISNNLVSSLYNALINSDSDVSSTSITYIPGPVIETSKCILNTKEYIKKVFYKDGVGDYSVAKLYKRKLFDNVKFKEGIIGEDFDIFYRLFIQTSKIVLTNESTYYYYQNMGSISIGKFNPKIFYRIKICNELNTIVKDNEIKKALHARMIDEAIYLYGMIPLFSNFQNEKKWIKDVSNYYYYDVINDHNITSKTKKRIMIFHYFPLYFKVRLILKNMYIILFKTMSRIGKNTRS